MSQPHAAAILARLSGVGTVYDGHVPPNPSYPYAVVWIGSGERDPLDLTTRSVDLDLPIRVTSVGATAAAARITADRVAVALIDAQVSVSGWTCWPIRHDIAQPATEDRDITIPGTGTHPVYIADSYRLHAVRD